MGRKKSPVTRKCIGQSYEDPAINSSSSSASHISSVLGDVSPSSLRGLAAMKQEPMEIEKPQLPSFPIQGLETSLPNRGEALRGRNNRRKRRNSGDNTASSRRRERVHSSDEEEEEVVTISVSELEKWQQRVIFHVEDHFTNEQLKRIAEFGRVHATISQEAKQYVADVEIQLKNQLEQERAVLRAQAEEFVAKTTAENKKLRQQVGNLEQQLEGLEKQVDTLQQEIVALKLDKQQKGKEREKNSEHQQQTHSPLNHRTQVQPEDEEVEGDVENHSSNELHDTNGYQSGEKLKQLLIPPKRRVDEVDDHRLVSKANLPLRHEVDVDKTRQLQHQQHSSANTKGTPSHSTEEHDGIEAPKGAGE